MKRKSKSRASFGNGSNPIPSSSHPEAEIGLRFAPPVQRADRPRRHTQKPIVSISGRDVEEIPDTVRPTDKRAA